MQPVEGKFHAVASAIAGMVVGGGDDGDARGLERGDHLRLGFEDHALFHEAAAIGKGRFEIDEGDIGGAQHGRQIAQRRGGVVNGARQASDVAREHDVAAQKDARLFRLGNRFGRLGAMERNRGEHGQKSSAREHHIRSLAAAAGSRNQATSPPSRSVSWQGNFLGSCGA